MGEKGRKIMEEVGKPGQKRSAFLRGRIKVRLLEKHRRARRRKR